MAVKVEAFGYEKGTKLVGLYYSRKSSDQILVGPLSYFVHGYFGYTLECGASWNPKINSEPKTLKSLVKNVNDSFYEKNEYYSSVSAIPAEELKEILSGDTSKVHFCGNNR